jgi:hypothetical protein
VGNVMLEQIYKNLRKAGGKALLVLAATTILARHAAFIGGCGTMNLVFIPLFDGLPFRSA